MEIDLIFDSNEYHYFLHYNFDYNFHYQFDEDYYNYSNVVDQNIDYAVDQIDDEYNVVVGNDLWNNVM